MTGSARRFLPLIVGMGFALGLTAPIELLYATRFHIGAVGMGLFLFATSIGMVAVDVLGTRVVPRVDARAALTLGLVGFGVSVAILGMAPTYEVLLVGRVVQGFAAGVLLGAGLQGALRVTASQERALGNFNAALLFGSAVGAPAGGLLAGVVAGTAGFRIVFLTCTALCFTVAVLLRVLLPPLEPSRRVPTEVGWPKLAGRAGSRLALVLGAAGDFVRGAVVYTAIPLAGAAHHFSPALIGAAVGLLSAVEIGVLSTSAPLLVRFGAAHCVQVALVLGVASAAVLAIAANPVVYLAGSVLFGFVVAVATIGPPLVIVALADEPATGLAAFRISSGLGMLIGTTGAGVGAEAMGTSAVFVLVGGVLLGGVALAHSVGQQVRTAAA